MLIMTMVVILLIMTMTTMMMTTSWRESLVGSSVQLPAHCVHHLRLPNLPAYIPIEYSVIRNTCQMSKSSQIFLLESLNIYQNVDHFSHSNLPTYQQSNIPTSQSSTHQYMSIKAMDKNYKIVFDVLHQMVWILLISINEPLHLPCLCQQIQY